MSGRTSTGGTAPRDWWAEYQAAAQRLDLARRRLPSSVRGSAGTPDAPAAGAPAKSPGPSAERTGRPARRLRRLVLVLLPVLLVAGGLAWWVLAGR